MCCDNAAQMSRYQASVFQKTCGMWQILTSTSFSYVGLKFALNSIEFNSMASLPNYLRTHRKRLTLSQEEVALLLGIGGMDKGIKVCRDENCVREPSLQIGLAYEVIYGKPVRELFRGIYEQVERKVAERAKVLSYRKAGRAKRQEVLSGLIAKANS